jgi:histidine triad (HIT) family protein
LFVCATLWTFVPLAQYVSEGHPQLERFPLTDEQERGMATDCMFCEEAHLKAQRPERVVYEDERFYVIHPLDEEAPTYLGTLMIVARRHIPSFADLSAEEAQALGLLLARVTRALKVATGAEHAYAYYFGEGFRHLHAFIVARYDTMPGAFVRLDVERWPDAPRGDAAAVAALCARAREALAENGANAL